METGNDTHTKNQALTFNKLYFGFVFWGIFVLVMAAYHISKGNEILDRMVKVKGLVVDEIKVINGRTEVIRPQVSYPVGDSSYLFVDHDIPLARGEKPTVFYWKEDPQNAMVYTFWFWMRLGDIIPWFLLSLLVFRVVIIFTNKYKEKTVTLPSNTPL